MSAPQLSPDAPPPPEPGNPGEPASPPGPPPPPTAALGTLGLIVGPGLLCWLIAVTAGPKGSEPALVVVLLISGFGSLIGGILAGRRLARRFAGTQEPSLMGTVGFCFACVMATGVLSVGGCLVGVISSVNSR